MDRHLTGVRHLRTGVQHQAPRIDRHLLAKDKGRNVSLWTVLGLIPLVNFICMFFFVGASNLRLEKKLDALLEQNRNAAGSVQTPGL